jgi:hypothetical protein
MTGLLDVLYTKLEELLDVLRYSLVTKMRDIGIATLDR